MSEERENALRQEIASLRADLEVERRRAGDDDDRPDIIPPPRVTRPSGMIRGITSRLPIRGHIKIGEKGELRQSRSTGIQFQPPAKLDHFNITTLVRDPENRNNFKRDHEIHAVLGDRPTEIPIRLLYDPIDLNLVTRYACFLGPNTLWCTGNGETAVRLSEKAPPPRDLEQFNKARKEPFNVRCTCERIEAWYPNRDKCKPNAMLLCMLDYAEIGLVKRSVGGIWAFRTGSWNTISYLKGGMEFLHTITGGILANIPLTLRIQPEQRSAPQSGSQVTIYTVSLEYVKGSLEDLQRTALQIARSRAETKVSMAQIEDLARQRLAQSGDRIFPIDETNQEVVEEFYPEVAIPEEEPAPKAEDFVEGQTVPLEKADLPDHVMIQEEVKPEPEPEPPPPPTPAQQPERRRGRPPRQMISGGTQQVVSRETSGRRASSAEQEEAPPAWVTEPEQEETPPIEPPPPEPEAEPEPEPPPPPEVTPAPPPVRAIAPPIEKPLPTEITAAVDPKAIVTLPPQAPATDLELEWPDDITAPKYFNMARTKVNQMRAERQPAAQFVVFQEVNAERLARLKREMGTWYGNLEKLIQASSGQS